MSVGKLAKQINDKATGSSRFVVAVAGPPASGKSTVANNLCDALAVIDKNANPIVVPMDGFHLDNVTLDKLNLRHRKGTAETFDAEAFVDLVQQIHSKNDVVKIPEFDRTLDKVVDLGKTVTTSNKIVIIEGNYLFLEEGPWKQLSNFFDMSIFLLPKTKLLEERLIDRWLKHGYPQKEAEEKAYANDIPNAKFILANSAYIELTFEEIIL